MRVWLRHKDGAPGETIEVTGSDGRELVVTIPAATKLKQKILVKVPPTAAATRTDREPAATEVRARPQQSGRR